MMKNTKATLVLASIGVLGTAYCPVQKNAPSKEFIETTYISPVQVLGKEVMIHDENKSEERRKLLESIRENEREIVRMQKQLEIMGIWQRSGKLIDTVTSTISGRTRYRMSKMVSERAMELGLPRIKKLLDPVRVAQRKGIVIIDEFEI